MMKRSRMRWSIGVIAPWCVGMALLMSFTADAGQMGTVSGSLAALSATMVGQPEDLVPLSSLARGGDLGNFGLPDATPLLTPAAYVTGADAEFKAVSDDLEPRLVLKRNAGAFPAVDRSHKGDPMVGLRPTFQSELQGSAAIVAARRNGLIAPHDDAMPTAGFSLADDGGPLDGATAFAPWTDGEDMQNAEQDGEREGNVAISMRPAALLERLAQGATPPVSRAEALSSTTPAPAEDMPVVATFAPQPNQGGMSVPDTSVVPRVAGRPNYAALLVGDRGAREKKCLAEAIYFEARSEPEEGQAAVAQVVLNRATSGLYPASICGVVYQNRTHYKACQFSFACEGKSLRVNEPDAWHTAVRIADAVVEGRTYLSDVGGATHYHANYVRPGWARRLVKMDVIGHHVFYKLRRGQT